MLVILVFRFVEYGNRSTYASEITIPPEGEQLTIELSDVIGDGCLFLLIKILIL